MQVQKTLQDLSNRINTQPQGITGLHAVYHFVLSGEEGGTYEVVLSDNQADYSMGVTREAGCKLELSDQDFVKLVEGRLNPTVAFVTGKLKISGEMGLSFKLQTILHHYQSRK
ncbi:SCP2 sterol-binding domain-containing protein [Brevibacillus brevis]|uniref:SCP2 sterol-binding domain-containing protein n=1 Tax=Brevibacillus brevis TaxID=1393 RepID=UPI001C8E68F1|nr:SCP2 sterol-binding domain-containing protein [Brevibacillus brevis]MBY0088805.1 SCP2 sterol-binding domain-containing protein [Brevibacillus brevis]UKK99099.1 SCP2 sterol-binding domain-containing protein [Brevibacillus brevis]